MHLRLSLHGCMQQQACSQTLFSGYGYCFVRRLLSYNEAQERAQNRPPPAPTFTETIPSSSSRGSVRLLYHYPPGTFPTSSPAKTKHPIVIDFHGGAFSSGVPSMSDRWIASLHTHATTHPVVVSVDYSLAPEYPFPAAIQDAIATISYLSTLGAAKHSLDPSRIVLTGWSAGGTLALTTPLWLHSHPDSLNHPLKLDSAPAYLRGILAVYPQTDCRLPRSSVSIAPSSRLIRFLNETWDLAYARRVEVESPFISPAAATDELLQTGLPDTIALYTVADDPLCPPAENFRERLRGLGKQVTGDIEPGAAHAWDKSPITRADRESSRDGGGEGGKGGDEIVKGATGRVDRWKKREEWFARMARGVDTMLR